MTVRGVRTEVPALLVESGAHVEQDSEGTVMELRTGFATASAVNRFADINILSALRLPTMGYCNCQVWVHFKIFAWVALKLLTAVCSICL